MNLIKNRKWLYLFSLFIIIPGTISLVVWGLKPSIDFTGGTVIEVQGVNETKAITDSASNNQIDSPQITKNQGNVLIRTKTVDETAVKNFKTEIGKIQNAKITRIETIGPSVSKEITKNAIILVLLASAVIVFYIAYSFRKVPKPASSWEFGAAAIIDLLHDALLVLGIFSILGHFFNVEIDPLFITAILTVIGFSVHDTIVIFDRIRENLIRGSFSDFETTVATSISEMLPRTLATSFLVWVILFILFVLGGESIKYFVLALVIGILSGTYSSICTSSPLLVTWENFKKGRARKAL